MVLYRWSFETNPISGMVAESVKHLAKHIPTENALITIFVLRAKYGVVEFNFGSTVVPEMRHASQ